VDDDTTNLLTFRYVQALYDEAQFLFSLSLSLLHLLLLNYYLLSWCR
jgi:hypothetical protein